MKITEDSIFRMFEGTKQLVLGAFIAAMTGTLILMQSGYYSISKAPLIAATMVLMVIIAGFIAMLFSPITYKTAKIFDIASNKTLCRIISGVFFLLYLIITTLLVNFIAVSIFGKHDAEDMSLLFFVGCFIVSVVQSRRYFKLITA
ncbi:hypothetical protein [Vagococcus sp. WN89Y]|uniref:hypothetical protein n=1 Tax=Vagococcus sp. WN89Y TaxID=3457258 RepID=UPI003FCC4979